MALANGHCVRCTLPPRSVDGFCLPTPSFAFLCASSGCCFSDATTHLYKRVCPSVRPSVRPSARPSFSKTAENKSSEPVSSLLYIHTSINHRYDPSHTQVCTCSQACTLEHTRVFASIARIRLQHERHP